MSKNHRPPSIQHPADRTPDETTPILSTPVQISPTLAPARWPDHRVSVDIPASPLPARPNTKSNDSTMSRRFSLARVLDSAKRAPEGSSSSRSATTDVGASPDDAEGSTEADTESDNDNAMAKGVAPLLRKKVPRTGSSSERWQAAGKKVIAINRALHATARLFNEPGVNFASTCASRVFSCLSVFGI